MSKPHEFLEEALEEKVSRAELNEMLSLIGEREFGGDGSVQMKDIAELTDRTPQDLLALLREVRGESGDAERDKKIAALEARNRLLAADVRRIRTRLDEEGPADLQPANRSWTPEDQGAKIARQLAFLVFGIGSGVVGVLYLTWLAGWWS